MKFFIFDCSDSPLFPLFSNSSEYALESDIVCRADISASECNCGNNSNSVVNGEVSGSAL